ncbi:hypothetical protein PF002_g14548, partial [Phytophthora fragariae]
NHADPSQTSPTSVPKAVKIVVYKHQDVGLGRRSGHSFCNSFAILLQFFPVKREEKPRGGREGELKNRALREERARRRAGERLEGPAASQEAPAEALEAQEGSQDRSEHSAARRNHSQRPRRHRTSAFHAHSSGRLLLRRRPSSVEINSSSFTA